MYKKNPYKHTHVTTASPGELVVMLYDGAIKFTSAAEGAFDDGDMPLAATSIARAVAILNYLQSVLDERHSPELVAQLDRLYMGWTQALTKANVSRDPETVIRVREEIAEMREAWAEVHRINSTTP